MTFWEKFFLYPCEETRKRRGGRHNWHTRCVFQPAFFLFPVITSLDYHIQVHAWVNRTVVMECAGRIECAKGCSIIATELYIVRNRSSAFRFFDRIATYPTAIEYFVWHGCIINQSECIAFMDGDRGYDEISSAHVNRWASAGGLVPDGTGGQ